MQPSTHGPPVDNGAISNVSVDRLNKRMFMGKQPKDTSGVNKNNVVHLIKVALSNILE